MNLEEFYKENYSLVFGYLYSLCGDVHMAEDLTSETFLRAILKIDSYDGRVKASTWLCAIGKNLFINECKRRSRQVPLEGVPRSEEQSMEETYLQLESERSLLDLIRGLTPPKDQVVLMRQQGMCFREIGEALGKSENWARVTFFRAKSELLERWEGQK